MPEHDTYTDPGRADAAGWVLGALDPHEAGNFEEHLRSCAGCQAAVAELQPAARMLRTAAPAVQPPADLQERTLASVRRAAETGKKVRTSGRRRWNKWNIGMLSLAATAAVAVAVIVVALQVLQPPAANAVTIPLHPGPGVTASGPKGVTPSGLAVARHTADGWSIQLTIHGLKELGHGRIYECRYVGRGNRSGRLDLISAGTFTVDASGSATMQMWSAADPYKFPIMQIVSERIGDGQHGQIILNGSPRR
jgi:hypothetical protein